MEIKISEYAPGLVVEARSVLPASLRLAWATLPVTKQNAGGIRLPNTGLTWVKSKV